MHVLIATDGSRTAVDAARAVDLFDRPEHVTLLSVLTSLKTRDRITIGFDPGDPERGTRERGDDSSAWAAV